MVGLIMIGASAVSYELVHLTEARPAAVEVEGAEPPAALGVMTTVVPVVSLTEPAVDNGAPGRTSMSEAALLAATGAALFVVAAGVKRRAC